MRLSHPLLLVPLLALTACPRPLRFGPEGELTDPAYVLRRLDAHAARVHSVKAEAKVSVDTGNQSGTVTEFVAAARPASLHLETLNFFGKPVAGLATDGTRFGLFMEESGTFYSGPATAANVGRLLPVALAPDEAVALLLGGVHRLAGADLRLELDRDARAYRLTLSRGTITQTLWVGTEDLRLLRSEVRGANSYDTTFDDFQAFGDLVVPTALEVRAVRPDGSPAGPKLSLRYKDLEVNGELDQALFVLEPPPGARWVRLDAQGLEVPEPAPEGK